MPAASTIIDVALRLLGIKSASTQEQTQGLDALNALLKQWSTERLLIYALTEESFSLASGQTSRTIGTGGNFNTSRPQGIVDAFIRDANNYDYPVDVSMTQEEYNRIASKTTVQGRPTKLFYKSEYPLGKIYFNLKTENTETLLLFSMKPLTQFPDLNTSVSLPDEYEEALQYNLALRLAPQHSVRVDDLVTAFAIASRQNLKNINTPIVAPIGFDGALMGSKKVGSSGYPAVLRG